MIFSCFLSSRSASEPSADGRTNPRPHCHWLVAKTDVTVLRSCLFVPNRHLNTGGGASNGDRNHVTTQAFSGRIGSCKTWGLGVGMWGDHPMP